MVNREEPQRCDWCLASAAYRDYHDHEWGVPLHDEHRLFEFLCLEGAQAGLSWLTILNKREGYREAFDGFDPTRDGHGGHIKLFLPNADERAATIPTFGPNGPEVPEGARRPIVRPADPNRPTARRQTDQTTGLPTGWPTERP